MLHEVKEKHLTQAEAAERLKVTDRQVRRLLLALEERGDGAVPLCGRYLHCGGSANQRSPLSLLIFGAGTYRETWLASEGIGQASLLDW